MTTTVLLGISGNKAVKVTTPQGDKVLQPGRWVTLPIHGDQALTVSEVGEFVDPGAAWVPMEIGTSGSPVHP